jgi:hypothetical protein
MDGLWVHPYVCVFMRESSVFHAAPTEAMLLGTRQFPLLPKGQIDCRVYRPGVFCHGICLSWSFCPLGLDPFWGFAHKTCSCSLCLWPPPPPKALSCFLFLTSHHGLASQDCLPLGIVFTGLGHHEFPSWVGMPRACHPCHSLPRGLDTHWAGPFLGLSPRWDTWTLHPTARTWS